jgi:tetratricopeptide (TPR) repeat protein
MAAAIWIVIVALPALAFVLWPLLRRGTSETGLLPISYDRWDELSEEKRAIYRALKELDFDHEAGHLSDGDYEAIRSRYEGRAAQILKELDAIEASRPKSERPKPEKGVSEAPGRPWTRRPATLIAGALALMVFGVALGLGVARYSQPDRAAQPPVSLPPAPADPSQPITSDALRSMLEAARQSLFAGRYQEAIAAYQAVLKRDPKNVDAITHMGLIVATGGHGDSALEAFQKAIALDPSYPPAYLYRGQVLYETKQDYRGAIQAWEKFIQLVPEEENKELARRMIQEAKARLASQAK